MVDRMAKPKGIPLDRWIEANIRLPLGLTAEPGPIRGRTFLDHHVRHSSRDALADRLAK